MSLLFQDDEQRALKHPLEIWNTVARFSADPQPFIFKIIKGVLALVSKEFYQLAKKLTSPSKLDLPLRAGSIAIYCCRHGYASLLQYALKNGAIMVDAAITHAAREGHLECLKITEDHGCVANELILNEAARKNHLSVVQYIIDKGIKPTTRAVGLAVKTGKIEFVKYLLNLVPSVEYEDLGYNAALSGSLEMVKYIEQFTPLQKTHIAASAGSGSIEVLQYFLDKGFVLEDDAACIVAAAEGHDDYVKFAVNHGSPTSAALMKILAENNKVELMKELRAKGCPWNASAIIAAVTVGNFEALKFLVDNGCPFEDPVTEQNVGGFGFGFGFNDTSKVHATARAAGNGHIDCLKYLMEHGAPWPNDIIDNSISIFNKAQLEVTQYLMQKGCPYSAMTCAKAAGCGHLELLQYLHENKCPWDELTCASAARNGNVQCLKYALDNACPWDVRTMDSATESGSLKTIQLLYERGIPWTNNTCTALIRHSDYEMLKFAHENGAPWTNETIANGLKSINTCFKCFKYAIDNGCPWDPQSILAVAREYSSQSEIAEWIVKNYVTN